MATIERLRHEPGGVLIQTTHWRESLSRSGWLIVAAIAVVLITDLPGEDARERGITLVVSGIPTLIVVAYWLYVRGRTGVVAGPGTLMAKGAFSRPRSIDTSAVLDEDAYQGPIFRNTFVAYRGLLMHGSKWQCLPGLSVRAGQTSVPGVSYGTDALAQRTTVLAKLLTRRPARLVTRPARPWYLPPARATIHEDVVWEPGDDARAVRIALGLAPVRAAPAGAVGSAEGRLERWNREAA